MSASPTPTTAGFYWAKWRLADDGTVEGDELTPSDKWEVVDVFENCVDQEDDEYLMAHVPGVQKAQALENFHWGPEVTQATDALNAELVAALRGLSDAYSNGLFNVPGEREHKAWDVADKLLGRIAREADSPPLAADLVKKAEAEAFRRFPCSDVDNQESALSGAFMEGAEYMAALAAATAKKEG